MQVQRALSDVVQHLRHRHLDCGDIAADLLVVVVLVDQPCGAQHQQPELLDLDPAVGDLFLGHLEIRQRTHPGLAGDRSLTHHVECPPGQCDGAHGVMNTPAAQPGLRDREGLALTAEDVVGRHPNVGVTDVAVRGVRLRADADVADDLDARCSGGDDEQGHFVAGAGVGIGDRHDDEKRGVAGVGGKPFLAVDDPGVAVALGAGHEQARIRTPLWFGHGVTRGDLAGEQRFQIARLLFGGAEQGQDLGVAGVRCLRAEHRRGPAGPAHDFIQQRELDLAIALAAEFGLEMRRPQAVIPDLLLQRTQGRHGLGILFVVRIERHQVEWLELVDHEFFDPVQFLLVFGVRFEVPHGF